LAKLFLFASFISFLFRCFPSQYFPFHFLRGLALAAWLTAFQSVCVCARKRVCVCVCAWCYLYHNSRIPYPSLHTYSYMYTYTATYTILYILLYRERQPAAICFYAPLGYCTFDFELLRIFWDQPHFCPLLPFPFTGKWKLSNHFTCPIYCYFFLTKRVEKS